MVGRLLLGVKRSKTDDGTNNRFNFTNILGVYRSSFVTFFKVPSASFNPC